MKLGNIDLIVHVIFNSIDDEVDINHHSSSLPIKHE